MNLTANRIGEKELDVHHISKVGIKRFWPQEAKMSRTELGRIGEKKILIKCTSCLESRNQPFFGSGGPTMLTAINSLESARRMNTTYITSRK